MSIEKSSPYSPFTSIDGVYGRSVAKNGSRELMCLSGWRIVTVTLRLVVSAEEVTVDAPSWTQYVTAIGTVATPILVAALTAVGWRLRNRLER